MLGIVWYDVLKNITKILIRAVLSSLISQSCCSLNMPNKKTEKTSEKQKLDFGFTFTRFFVRLHLANFFQIDRVILNFRIYSVLQNFFKLSNFKIPMNCCFF